MIMRGIWIEEVSRHPISAQRHIQTSPGRRSNTTSISLRKVKNNPLWRTCIRIAAVGWVFAYDLGDFDVVGSLVWSFSSRAYARFLSCTMLACFLFCP